MFPQEVHCFQAMSHAVFLAQGGCNVLTWSLSNKVCEFS